MFFLIQNTLLQFTLAGRQLITRIYNFIRILIGYWCLEYL